jgi:hypothetical protein
VEQTQLVDYQFAGDTSHTFAQVFAPEHPSSLQLQTYWLECRAQHGAMRLGRDVPARAVTNLLRDLTVLEPIDGGTDYVFRLAGTGFLKRCGSDIKGRRFSTLYRGHAFTSGVSIMNACIREQQPMIYDVRLSTPLVTLRRHESIDLPIRSQDGSADLVLSGTFYFT